MSWFDEMLEKMKLADQYAKEKQTQIDEGYIKPKRRFYDNDDSYNELLRPYNERKVLNDYEEKEKQIKQFITLYDDAVRKLYRMELDEVEILISQLENYNFSAVSGRSLSKLKHRYESQLKLYDRLRYDE